jgi:predicted small secreted protein
MKKALILFVVVVLVLSVAACKGSGTAGGGKYADVQKVMDKYIGANEKFATALDGAKTADDIVAALNALTETTKAVAPELKAFDAKYPELKSGDNLPAELKPTMDRMMAAAGKMMGAMQKIAPFASDPKVQEAQTKFQEAQALIK